MNIEQHYRVLHKIAIQHKKLTGNSIAGLTGELGEWYTAKLLNLKLTKDQNTPGYDAVDNKGKKHQIKAGLPTYSISDTPSWKFNHVCRLHKWHYIDFCYFDNFYTPVRIMQLDKKALNMAQTISGEKYKSITSQGIDKYGEIVYCNTEAEDEFYNIGNNSKSKYEYIRELVFKRHASKTIIQLLNMHGYDTSNINSIRSMISQARNQLRP